MDNEDGFYESLQLETVAARQLEIWESEDDLILQKLTIFLIHKALLLIRLLYIIWLVEWSNRGVCRRVAWWAVIKWVAEKVKCWGQARSSFDMHAHTSTRYSLFNAIIRSAYRWHIIGWEWVNCSGAPTIAWLLNYWLDYSYYGDTY